MTSLPKGKTPVEREIEKLRADSEQTLRDMDRLDERIVEHAKNVSEIREGLRRV